MRNTHNGGIAMDLVERVRGLKKDTAVVTTPVDDSKIETLTVLAVPREILTEKDHQEQGIIPEGALGTYFDSYALDVSSVLLHTYGCFFDATRTAEEGAVRYVFQKRDHTVVYTIGGFFNIKSVCGRQRFSSDIISIFKIQKPELDLQRAGSFIDAIMNTHLLDYEHEADHQFGVLYHGKKKELGGIPLLKKMGVTPNEAAEYIQVGRFGCYYRKIFREGELDL
ncbi:hypothetical protein HY496_03360 [Candidatus Woesearchaeota archaeon]|nr:hypothetical protein [Candidatus Woesearchaeota archaeon]